MDNISYSKQNDNIIKDISNEKQKDKQPKTLNNTQTKTIFDIQERRFTLFGENDFVVLKTT